MTTKHSSKNSFWDVYDEIALQIAKTDIALSEAQYQALLLAEKTETTAILELILATQRNEEVAA